MFERIFDFLFGRKPLPPVESNLSYGADPQQRVDVYHPDKPNGECIVFVHGGGWDRGSEDAANVVDNKRAHWLPLGVTLVFPGYRLDVDPYAQAQDVLAALAFAQKNARKWKLSSFTLMAHSAGAHLSALAVAALGAKPDCLVLLDSAVLDVPALMEHEHPVYPYDQAFGADPAFWLKCSPRQSIRTALPPTLLVYSTLRSGNGAQVNAFDRTARSFGTATEILPVAMDHEAINAELGLPGDYTAAVDDFQQRFVS